MSKPSQLAVLIDMDPLEPRLLGRILEKAADHGTIGIRRAYGNRVKLSDWEACLRYRGIEAASNYGRGTNAADITLIIDAVDMLRTGKADGFCIVASDHHYTGLIKWLRDREVLVAGIGGPRLRDEFGGLFTDIRDLSEPAKAPDGACWEAERALIGKVRNAVEDSPKSPDGYVRLSVVHGRLGYFEARAYCHRDLVSLLRWYGDEFDVMDGRSIGGPPGDYVRVRPSRQAAGVTPPCPPRRRNGNPKPYPGR